MRRRPTLILLPLAVAVASVVSVVSGAPIARAHTEVQRATPGPGQEVAGPVDRVDLVFLDPVLPTVTIAVTGPDGRVVPGLGDVEHGDDARRASVRFDDVEAEGAYVVEYAFVAVDGDAQSDAYRFTVTGGAGSVTGSSGLVVLGGGVVVLGVALAIALRRRRAP